MREREREERIGIIKRERERGGGKKRNECIVFLLFGFLLSNKRFLFLPLREQM